MKLYGTVTSPFVRRVRIVADELGLPLDLVDTSTPDGQSLLRTVSPIAKVPVAELAGEVVFDSRVIIELLLDAHGHGQLRPSSHAVRVAESNVVSAVDAALEAAIRVFYVKRDGGDPGAIPYLAKERDRVKVVMTWVASQLHGAWCTRDAGFGLGEVALLTALSWMRFRGAYTVDDHPALVAFEAVHAGRPSVARSAPV